MKRKIVNLVLIAAMLLNIFGALTAFADDVVYDDRYMATFTDDFSDGLDMTKWSPSNSDGTTACSVEDGKLKIGSAKTYDGIRPIVDDMSLANVSYQFEATGMDTTPLQVVFSAVGSGTDTLKVFVTDKTSTDWRKCVAIQNKNASGETSAVAAPDYEYDGGTNKTHTIKISITVDYTVKVYVDDMTEPVISKTQDELGLNFTGTYKAPTIHYGENTVSNPVTRIDNVKLTYPAPKVYGTEEHAFEENFDSADWKSDWDDQKTDVVDTYDAEKGTVVLGAHTLFAKNVSGKELKASLTVDTAAALDYANYGLYVRFQNVEDSNDKVSIAISGNDNEVFVCSDSVGTASATLVKLEGTDTNLKLSTWDKTEFFTQTYTFELTGSSLVITETNDNRKPGSTAGTNKKVLTLPNFSSYFTAGASYKVGLTQGPNDGTLKIDKFTVDVGGDVSTTVGFGGKTFEDDFSSETWNENWSGAIGSNGNVQYNQKDGKIYPQDGRVMYANGISGKEMIVTMTLGGGSVIDTTGANSVGIRFTNTKNADDYVDFYFRGEVGGYVCSNSDTNPNGTETFTDVRFNADDTGEVTFTFKLTSDAFTAVEGNGTEQSMKWSSRFDQDFTADEYKVGIYTVGCSNNETLYISSFKVEIPDTNAVSVSLQAEVAADTYKSVSKVEAGVNYKVTLNTETEIEDAVYMAAVYDGDRFIDVHMLNAGEAHNVLVPFGAKAPRLKIFAWENFAPMVPAFTY